MIKLDMKLCLFLTYIIILFLVPACSSSEYKNIIFITNDNADRQEVYFGCTPRDSPICPYKIQSNTTATYKNVSIISIVHKGKIFEVNFPKTGEFNLQLNWIIHYQKHLNDLKGQCITLKKYGSLESIDCNTGVLVRENH